MSKLVFRVWDKKAEEYAPITCVLGFLNKSSEFIGILQHDDYVIEPFAEKYDKHGRGIFVGDIVRKTWLTGWILGPYTGEVVKKGDCFLIEYKDERFPSSKKEYTSLEPYSYQQYDSRCRAEREDYEYEVVDNAHKPSSRSLVEKEQIL